MVFSGRLQDGESHCSDLTERDERGISIEGAGL
jgi:hypothetical protein